jgi:hypothetical protein
MAIGDTERAPLPPYTPPLTDPARPVVDDEDTVFIDGTDTGIPQWAAQLIRDIGQITRDIAHIRSVLDRAMPVIDAYLDPAASGPGAWAVRRQLKKRGQDG